MKTYISIYEEDHNTGSAFNFAVRNLAEFRSFLRSIRPSSSVIEDIDNYNYYIDEFDDILFEIEYREVIHSETQSAPAYRENIKRTISDVPETTVIHYTLVDLLVWFDSKNELARYIANTMKDSTAILYPRKITTTWNPTTGRVTMYVEKVNLF